MKALVLALANIPPPAPDNGKDNPEGATTRMVDRNVCQAVGPSRGPE